ncbi:MAG: hypothetical protein ACN6O3_04780 [Comamonas sp.]
MLAHSLRRVGLAAVAGLALLLAGCAYPTQFKPGDTEAQVQAKLGPPSATVPLPGGGQRLTYTTQPMGREAFQLSFDAGGRLLKTEQVLTAERFGAIPMGQYTVQQLLQDFGPPMEITGVYSFDGRIYTYRLWQDNIKRLAHVHVDPQGVARRLMFTDEPMPEPRDPGK